jgi:tripartite-type tricarboxylate transporter receptor subunit TctC
LAEILDRTVIVENKAGANTILGTVAVARSQPDGRTLLLGGTAFVVNTALYKGKLSYDPVRDFEPISLLATSRSVLVTHPGLGVQTLAELLQLLKSKPGEVTYASAGSGNMTHLGMEVFKSRAGVNITHVPYRGANPALTDVLAGHVPLMFVNPGAIEEYVRNRRLIAIAVTGEKRLNGLPGVPTFAEAGVPLPELNFGTWFGLLAPAGTPKAIISHINTAVIQAVEDTEIQAKMQPLGFQPEAGSSEGYAAMLKAQLEQWPPIVERAGIKIE